MSISRRDFLKASAAGAAVTALSGCRKKSGTSQSSFKALHKWKMVTTWPKNFPGLGTGANLLAERIEQMSGGRIEIKVFGAGELVPALGVFDAVSRGTAEMGHSAAYYWQGKHSAAPFFAAVPFGLNAIEMNAWLDYGGGQALWEEVYSDFNIQPFSAGNTGVQMGGWFNKEIKTVQDFKGLKMRMPGLGGEVLSRLGSAVVTLPGGEIFQALKLGNIDATEWVGPYNDLAFGLYKAAKFYYWPGWHEPGTTLEALINKTAYNTLSDDLKLVVKVACQSCTQDMFSEFSARNSLALETLVEQKNVILKKFPDQVLKVLGQTSEEVVREVAKDKLTTEVLNSFLKFKKQSSNWNDISEAGYTAARRLTV